MPVVVIAVYKCIPGNQEKLFEILKRKRKYFFESGYVTKREPVNIRSQSDNSVIIEIFEWTSKQHIADAHEDKAVLSLWNEMEDVCEAIGIPLNQLEESAIHFAGFEPLNIY